MSDELCLASAKQGDDVAFATLYRNHVARVYSHVTRLIGPIADREDVTQQVFIALHRSLPSFRGDAKLSSFLFRLTANVAIDYLRKRKRTRSTIDYRDVEAVLPTGLSPEQRSQRRSELLAVFEALDQLSPKQRVAFTLVAIFELSYVEAGKILRARPAAIKQRVLSARKRLIRTLGCFEELEPLGRIRWTP